MSRNFGNNCGDDNFQDCTKTLGEALKKYKCDYVVVFEKNAIVIGRVKSVLNGSVLVLTDGFKFVDDVGSFYFEKVFISICEITEFIPIEGRSVEAVVSGLRESGNVEILKKD